MSERDPRAMRLTDMYLLLHVADRNIYTAEERSLVAEYRQKFKVRMELEQEERDFRSKNLGKKLGFFDSIKHKKLSEKIRVCINELTLIEADPHLQNLLARERVRSTNEMNEESKRIQEEIKQRKVQEIQAQNRRYQEERDKSKTARESAQANCSTNTEKSTFKSAVGFYNDCVADFHQEATKYGVAQRGVIFIPELISLGEKTILAFLQDRFFQMQFGNNAQMYYYAIMSLTIDAGIAYAARWHEQFSTLNSYVEEIIEVGPADDANLLLCKHFPKEISENQGNLFFQKVYSRWIAMHDPYWKLADPRDYTFKAMLAAYQLGVSMMLEKLGY